LQLVRISMSCWRNAVLDGGDRGMLVRAILAYSAVFNQRADG